VVFVFSRTYSVLEPVFQKVNIWYFLKAKHYILEYFEMLLVMQKEKTHDVSAYE